MCADILFSLEFGEEEELFEEEGGEEEDDGEGLLVLFVGEPLLAVLAVEAGDMLLGILSGRRCRRGGTRTRTREIWGESWELGLTDGSRPGSIYDYDVLIAELSLDHMEVVRRGRNAI
jgi:hypothetical protein